MATILYRLGKASYLHAWRVVVIWVVAFIAIGGAGVALGGDTQEEFRIPGSESQEAFNRLAAVFPGFGGGSAQVVIVAPEGQRLDTEENRAVIESLAQSIADSPAIEDTVSPFDEYAGRALSDDGRYALMQVQFGVATADITNDMLDELVSHRDDVAGTGLIVEFGGNLFQEQGVHLTIAELFGVIFAGLVLIVTFRSFRPAWQPLASALVGLGIAIGFILMAAGVVTVSSSAPLLAVMLGLAVGIDYSLFILQRHRNQLAAGADPRESAATAVGTAGNAVVFAGLTVVIALLGLFVVGIPFLSVMGASAALAVLIAIAAAITFLPALMGLMGEKLRPAPGSKASRIAAQSPTSPSMGRRWVRFVMKRPLLVTIVSIASLATLAIPALDLDLALPDGGSEPIDSTQRKAYDLVTEGFGPGYNGPLIVSADITRSDDVLADLEGIRQDLAALDGVDYVSEGFPSPTIDTGILQVIPVSGPDSRETKALVGELRNALPEIEQRWNTDLAVTGVTAIGVDVSQRIQSALIPFGLVVVGLSFLLLLVVFRSLLVPLKAALGFVLSVTAAFGVVVAVFQWGWLSSFVGVDTPGPILSFMPIILMAVLFGLAMDYQVFLVSGMREQYVHTGEWRSAIEEGYSQGARVVGAAALIMFFVFFAFVPEGIPLIKPIALGLAIGIALDAFVVRMTLVPALMTLFGKVAWALPAPLERLLPHADVEGEKLREHLHEVHWAQSQAGFVVSAENLVIASNTGVLDEETWRWEAGARIQLVGGAQRSAHFTATLAGVESPISGALQVGGYALPSEASRVRQLVYLVETSDEVSLRTLEDLVIQRMAFQSAVKPSSRDTAFALAKIVTGVNALCEEVCEPSERMHVTSGTVPSLLPHRQRIVIRSALAVIENTPVCVVGGGAPVSNDDDASLWWQGLNHFAHPDQVIVLWSATGPSRENISRPERDALADEGASVGGRAR